MPSVDEIPESVKLWRSMLQWVGGVGIVVFTVAFLARPGISAAALYIAEGRFERLEASLKASAIRMTLVYTVYTLLGAIIIYLSGMSLSDAIQHSMTAISTAGFSTHADSVGFYKGNYAVYASTLLVSLFGALSFVDLDNMMRLRLGRVLRSVEFRAILLLTAVSAVAATVIWYVDPVMRSSYSLADAVYNSVSGYITVGFSTASLEGASDSYKLTIAALGLIGGSAFSTAGGIKVLRLAIALKTLDVETTRILKPSSYVPKNLLGGRRLTEDMVKRSLAVIMAFTTVEVLLGLTAVALYSSQYSTVDIIFDVTSALANIGLSTGVTSPEAPADEDNIDSWDAAGEAGDTPIHSSRKIPGGNRQGQNLAPRRAAAPPLTIQAGSPERPEGSPCRHLFRLLGWCGGWDLNPRRPTPTGLKPAPFGQARAPPHHR